MFGGIEIMSLWFTKQNRPENKGRFGNYLSKKCCHKFEHGNWQHKNCIRCGAVNPLFNKEMCHYVGNDSKLRRIYRNLIDE
jgi:hypothetical protein